MRLQHLESLNSQAGRVARPHGGDMFMALPRRNRFCFNLKLSTRCTLLRVIAKPLFVSLLWPEIELVKTPCLKMKMFSPGLSR
ncbi:hypothetical protein QQF64_014057 [Cirrhinus molitorella]|uniref:Uncharacterized protein n=1 Tax=Cirrhinus molitorella TaxID=172907 RepID=A0ABR3LSX9_9TELE